MTYPDDVPRLADADVLLRAFEPGDLSALAELLTDPETVRWSGIPEAADNAFVRTRLAAFATEWDAGHAFRFAVQAADDVAGTLLGHVSLVTVPGSVIAEISCGTHPAARGRGVATNAVRLLLDWAFETLGLATVTWRTLAGNDAAWRVAWSNGFTFGGTSRASIDHHGSAMDGWHATLLRDDDREPKTRWLGPTPLTHVGVVLRETELKDQDRYLETLSDPESQLWLGTIPLPRTPETFRTAVRDRRLNGSLGRSLSWAVAHPDTDAYLANIYLFDLDGLDYRSGEVGYRTHPDSRGRGVLTSALRAVVAYAFTPIDEGGVGLERLTLLAGDGNLASQGVAHSLGFTETGRDRKCYDLSDGRVVDLVRFDLLREEFTGDAR